MLSALAAPLLAATVAAYALLTAAGAAVTGRPLQLVGSVVVGLVATVWCLRARTTVSEGRAESAWLAPRAEAIGVTLCVVCLTVIGFVALDHFPGLRGDESLILQFPANDARHGQWGMRTDGGLKPWLWMTSTGPPLIAPAAALMKRFGVDVASARLVSGCYLLLCAVGSYLFVRRSSGGAAGIAAMVGFLGFREVVNTGRMFLGDFAACAFLFLGAASWLAAIEADDDRDRWRLLAAGVALGLMVLSKLAFSISVLGFVAYALFDRATERRVRARHLWVPALVVIAVNAPWELHKASTSSLLVSKVATTGWGSAYARLAPMGLVEKSKEVLVHPEVVLVLAGFVFALGAGPRARRAAVLAAFIGGVSLLWWLTFDIVLNRYLIMPTLAGIVVAAPLVAAAARTLREDGLAGVRGACALAVVTGGLLLPAARGASNVAKVVGASTTPWPEERVAHEIARRSDATTTLFAADVPYAILFFVDRPVRAVAAVAARELPVDALYVCRDRDVVDAEAFEALVDAGEWRLLRRR